MISLKKVLNKILRDLKANSERIDNLILGTGTSPVEVQDARLSSNGTQYTTLKSRLDAENSELKSDLTSETNARANADNALSARITNLGTHKVAQPLDGNNQPTNGTSGQSLRTKGDGTTEWAAVGLPTDTQTAAAVSVWLDNHPEATTTVQDGSITKEKLNISLIAELNKPFYDVTQYGILPNTGADLYEALFDFLHDTVAETGGIVYFPVGTYKISDCILIPPNTSFIGAGKETIIYYDATYSYFGTGLSNGGDNVSVYNMSVEHYSSKDIKTGGQGSHLGGIGFGTFDFNSWNTYHTTAVNRRTTKNLKAVNIWSDSGYILQTEPNKEYGISNVEYRNIYAVDSLVSVCPNSDNGFIKDVFIENIICGMLRVGVGYKNAKNVNINNLKCFMLYAPDGANINNSYIDNSTEDTWNWYDYALFFGGNFNIVNSRIIGGNSRINHCCASFSTTGNTVIFNNVSISGFDRIWVNNDVADNVFFSNCDFGGEYLYVINGSAVNCNAVFSGNPNFLDLTKKTEEQYTLGTNSRWSAESFPCLVSKIGKTVSIQGAIVLNDKTNLLTVDNKYIKKNAYIVVTLMYYNSSTSKTEKTTQCIAICDENGVFKLNSLLQDISVYNRAIFNGSYLID